MSNKANYHDLVINMVNCDYYFKSCQKINILENQSHIFYPLFKTDEIIFYNQLNLLIRTVNGRCIAIMQGDSAKKLLNIIHGENMYDNVNSNSEYDHIMNLLENISGLDSKVINSKSRVEKAVWARNLGIWYFRTIKKLSYNECGRLFTRDHATAIKSERDINEEDRFKKSWQIEMQHQFMAAIK